jgi:hypothetical protein
MNKSILASVALAAALSVAAPGGASAINVTRPLSPAADSAALVQKTGIYCGLLGCGPTWPGPRRSEPWWGPWDHVYRPACPIDYYYACRRGPLGYRQCACWPYPGR